MVFTQQFITEFHKKLISYLILISFFDKYDDTTRPTIKILLDSLLKLKQTKDKSNLNAIKLIKSKIKELTIMSIDLKNADDIIKMVIDNVGVDLKRQKQILMSEFY